MYSPFAYLYAHLHGYMLKSLNKTLSYYLQIVVAHDEKDSAVQSVEHIRPFCSITKAEVSQMEHDIITTYHAVPVGNYCLVHLLHVLERTIAVPDDVRMTEMRIGCKERVFCVKFVVHYSLHFLLVFVHCCMVN